MPIYKVNVKWVTNKFNELSLDTDEPPIVFKAQLMTLTDISVERQKVIIRGKLLEDEWDDINISNGQLITLMGQPGIPEPLNPAIKASSQAKITPTAISEIEFKSLLQNQIFNGSHEIFSLANHGNTCYLNAILQCLWAIPEICESLSTIESSSTYKDFYLSSVRNPKITPRDALFHSLGTLFNSTTNAVVDYNLRRFLISLRQLFPRYAEIDQESKIPRQHDASELLNDLMTFLREVLVFKCPLLKDKNLVTSFFGIKILSKTTGDDEEFESEESEYQLSCIITRAIDNMVDGIKLSLETNLRMHSVKHQEERDYLRVSQFKRLPAYLVVQFNRFFYREDTKMNAKILKNVTFPENLDLNSLCTPDLQARMASFRDKIESFYKKVGQNENFNNYNSDLHQPYWFEDDIGSNSSGLYNLLSVVTHMGRTSDSGHYVTWIRQKKNVWVKADDSNVSNHNIADVMKLSGGLGDWHIAYILIYGPRLILKEK